METIQLNGKQKGKQKKLLTDALCDAFRDLWKFEELLKFKLSENENFTDINLSNPLSKVALDIVERADSRGAVEELMKGALESNPKNQKLKLAFAAIISYHKLKPLEQEYREQIKDSYLTCCSDNWRKHDNNGHQTDNIIEIIFDFDQFLKEQKSDSSLALERLMKFVAYFLIKSKNSNLDSLKKYFQDLDENFTSILDEIEKKYNNKLYYDALLDLNFSEQLVCFEKINKNSVVSCIIHGKQGSGQRWLLHRLIQEITNESTNKPILIPIGLNLSMFAPNINNIFRAINRYTGKTQLSENETIDAIYNYLKIQNVIIVFHVNEIPEEIIKDFIHKLWIELVNKVQVNKDKEFSVTSKKSKLFMFLIDETGCVEKWTIQLGDSCDNNWKPNFPIKLPLIEKLSWQDLNHWIKKYNNVLPNDLTKLEESDIQSLLKTWDSGLFMTVLTQICDQCDRSLWEYIEECLK